MRQPWFNKRFDKDRQLAYTQGLPVDFIAGSIAVIPSSANCCSEHGVGLRGVRGRMPIYEFACQDCGHEFEKIQSFSDSSTPACPNCQGVHVQRRLSAPAIHFKGSGWYITDSKKAAKGSATGSTAGGD